jgi:hypothetical protein
LSLSELGNKGYQAVWSQFCERREELKARLAFLFMVHYIKEALASALLDINLKQKVTNLM